MSGVTFQKRFVLVVCILILCHVLACAYITILPSSFLGSSKIGVYYKSFFLIGPFFTEERIRISPHTLIRYHTPQSGWGDFVDYTHQHFISYSKTGSFDKLRRHRFEYNLFRKAFSNHAGKSSLEIQDDDDFHQVHCYIVKELLNDERMDSINVLYVNHTWKLKEQTVKRDTIFKITYHPATNAHVK